MLRKLVYLNFLLVLNQHRVLGFQPITINDHFLVDSTFKTLFIDDWLSCLQICDAEPRCVSYNFRKASGASGLCELNFCGLGDSLDRDKSLMYSRSFVFQQIREEKDGCNDCSRDHQGSKIAACRCCQCCNFDFEHGDLDGWNRTGKVFNNQPTYGDNPTARNRGQPAMQQGNWWIGGCEDRPNQQTKAGKIQGDGPQGTLTSPPFYIIDDGTISFLIGGGCDINKVRAELVINGLVVRKVTGECSETMAYHSWDAHEFLGQQARIRLVDNGSDGWGHINFDDLGGDICCHQSETTEQNVAL